MNKFLILFLASFAILFTSCGDDGSSTKTCDPACETWQTCNDGTCELTAGRCASDNDCKADAEKPKCDMTKHECVADAEPECTTNEDCTDAAKPVCDNGTCVADTPECTTNEDCTDTTKPVCDNGTCVADTPECTTNEDCTDAAKPVCDAGTCVADTPECTTNEDCTDAAKPVCDNGTCVAEASSDCIGLSFENIPKDEEYDAYYHQQVGDYIVNLEFYADSTPVGTYDLGADNNNNYEYCEQCVRIIKMNGEDVEKEFFQESGSLEVTTGDASTAESAGQVTTVKLVEVTLDGNYHSTVVENGECIEIQTGTGPWTWDSMPTCNQGDKRCNADNSATETCNNNNEWIADADCAAGTFCRADGDTFSCQAPPACVGLSFDAIDYNAQYGYLEINETTKYALRLIFKEDTLDGTYDLGAGDNTNTSTCKQCVLGYHFDADGNTDKIFFQESGSMTVTSGNANTPVSAGSVTTAKLVEISLDDNEVSTPVNGGDCIEIETGKTWAWDTSCTENDTRCNGDKVETCSAAGIWEETTDCTTANNVCAQPEGGAASCVVCVADSKQCNADGNVETCKADQTGWEVTETCTAPAVCSEDSFACEVPFVCEDHDLDGVGNDAANAMELTLPATDKTGYVCKDVDDWYKFDLTAGQSITIDLTFTHDDGDIDLKLYSDPAADAVETSGSMDDNEQITFTATDAGTYYLQIVSHYVDEGNSYTLNIQ